MFNSEPQTYFITSETLQFLSFCLISLKFLILEHRFCWLQLKKTFLRQQFFKGGARTLFAPSSYATAKVILSKINVSDLF